MAELKLRNNQLDGWGPHSPCMRCGAPATGVVRKTFTLRRLSGRYPMTSPFGQIEFLLLLFRPKRKQMNVPLCDRHKNHWRRYNFLTAGIVLLLLALYAGLVAGIIGKFGSLFDIRNKDAVGYLLLGILGIAAVLVVPAAIWVKAPIRPTEISDDGITLTGVADSFPGVQKTDSGQRSAKRLK